MSQNLANLTDYEALCGRISEIRSHGRALWGRMSACHTICHLADSFRSMLGAKIVSPPPVGSNETAGGGTPPVEFERDHKDLLEIMSKFRSSIKQTTRPMCAPLTHKKWMRWGYFHVDHHLRQFGK